MNLYKTLDKINKILFPIIIYAIMIVTSIRFIHSVKSYAVGVLMTIFSILLVAIVNVPMPKLLKYIMGALSFLILISVGVFYDIDIEILASVCFYIPMIYAFCYKDAISPLIAGIGIACLFFHLMNDSNRELAIGFIIGIISATIFFDSFFLLMATLKRERDKYKESDLIDSLTNCYNLNYVLGYGRELSIKAKTVTAFVMDIDHFKQINDTYGHMIGNNLLMRIAEVLNEEIRGLNGVVARLGGDEYVIILKDYTLKEAGEIYYGIKKRIHEAYFECDKELAPIRLSCSLGMGYMEVNESFHMEDLLHIADKDMYYIKQNKVYVDSSLDIEADEAFKRLLPLVEDYNILLTALSDKDIYTFVHSKYVAFLSVQFGAYLKLPEEDLESLFMAGWLHDIGKTLIPNEILRKRGKLSNDEYSIIKSHVKNSLRILSDFSLSNKTIEGVKHHHERVDGRGYPYGLKGEEISKEAKIMQIIDSFSAMTIKRVYRELMSIEEALKEIERNKNTQFDSEIADEFINMFQKLERRKEL